METLRNFTASGAVEWIHDLPHYDVHLNKVDNTFDPENREYLEALAMFGAPFYAVALLTLLLFVLRSVVKKCKRCCCQERRRVFDHGRAACVGVLVLVLFAGCMIASFVNNAKVGDACQDVGDSADSLLDMRDQTVLSATTIVDDLDSVASESNNLTPYCNSLAAKGVDEGKTLASSMASISATCSESSGDISDTVSQVDGYDMRHYVDEAHDYNRLRNTVQLVVLGVMLFPFLLLLLAIPCRARFLLWGVGWVAVVVGVLAWVLAGIESSACVGAADFCVDPNNFIQMKTRDAGADVQQYVQYYTQCDPSSVNPVETDIDHGRENVQAALLIVRSGLKYCASLSKDYIQQHNISREITALTQGLAKMNTTLLGTRGAINALDTTMKCANFNTHYVDALYSLCDDGVNSLGALLVCELAIGLLCFVAFFVARNFRHMFAPRSSVLRVQLLEDDEGEVFVVAQPHDQDMRDIMWEAAQPSEPSTKQ